MAVPIQINAATATNSELVLVANISSSNNQNNQINGDKNLTPTNIHSINIIENSISNNNNNNRISEMNSSNGLQKKRKRHSKRQTSDDYELNVNSTVLEWVNPCNGHFNEAAHDNRRRRRPNIKKFYRALKRSAFTSYKHLLSGEQYINITDMQSWLYRNTSYKFLPKSKGKRVAMKRWYRNLQTYVASFAYLRRVQLKWDLSKLQRVGNISKELKTLWDSSREVLCALETAINATHPYRPMQNFLPQVSREEMNRRLKLRTKRMPDADLIDLRFAKYYYYDFLKNMNLALRNVTRRKGQQAIGNETMATLMENHNAHLSHGSGNGKTMNHQIGSQENKRATATLRGDNFDIANRKSSSRGRSSSGGMRPRKNHNRHRNDNNVSSNSISPNDNNNNNDSNYTNNIANNNHNYNRQRSQSPDHRNHYVSYGTNTLRKPATHQLKSQR